MAQNWFSSFYTRFGQIRSEKPDFGVNVSKGKWTSDMMAFLRDLGEEQGFTVTRERLTIDQVWEAAARKVAIEHENDPNAVFRSELPKLMEVSANLKVVITYVKDYQFPWEPQYLSDRVMRTLDKKYPKQFEEFLLIVGTRSATVKGQTKRTFMERSTDWFAKRFYTGGIMSEVLLPPASLRGRRAWESRRL